MATGSGCATSSMPVRAAAQTDLSPPPHGLASSTRSGQSARLLMDVDSSSSHAAHVRPRWRAPAIAAVAAALVLWALVGVSPLLSDDSPGVDRYPVT
jgi:hypothetical protein